MIYLASYILEIALYNYENKQLQSIDVLEKWNF